MIYENIITGIRRISESRPGFDWYTVEFDPLNEWKLHGSRAENHKNHTVTYIAVYKPIGDAKQRGVFKAAELRWQTEVGGMAWTQPSTNATVMIATDRESQSKVLRYYFSATKNHSFVVENWKCKNLNFDDVWISLTNADIISIGDEMEEHVSTAFDLERERNVLIAAATTTQEIEDIFS